MKNEDSGTVLNDNNIEENNRETEAFKFQIEILKREMEFINDIYSHTDQITQSMKNWAILIWAGSIAIALGQSDLRKYIILTAILPILFWVMDAQWKHLQRRSGFRAQKIHQFLNDGRLVESFKKRRLVEFEIYDVAGRQYRQDEDFIKYVGFRRALNIREVKNFYLGLALLSVVFGVFFLFIS